MLSKSQHIILKDKLKTVFIGLRNTHVKYKGKEIVITDGDYYDDIGGFVVSCKDGKDLELPLEQAMEFINSITRLDGKEAIKVSLNNKELVMGASKSKHYVVPQKHYEAPKEEDEEELDDVLEEKIPEVVISEDDDVEPIPVITAPVKQTAVVISKKFVHVDSTDKIYVTSDYSRFGIIKGNRLLNKNKIAKIKQEIEAGTNLLRYCPIIVTEMDGKLFVVDGQHRLEVAKQCKKYIYYVISNSLSLYQIAKMNSNTEKWKDRDFVNCYAFTGNKNYLILKDFIEKTGYPTAVCLQLLGNGEVSDGSKSNLIEEFREGKFIVKKQKEAEQLDEIMKQFKIYNGYKSRAFIAAICTIIKSGKYPIKELVKSLNKNHETLVSRGAAKQYLIDLEIMVNIGKHTRAVIY